MKSFISFAILVFTISVAAYSQSFYGSQYFVGTRIDDSITSTPISDPGPGGCFPSPTYTITFPISKVTGVKNYMLITAVSSPEHSAYTTQIGAVNIGDTLAFTSQYPSYDFYFPKGGGIVYTIKAIGVPAVAGESYSCGQFVETTNPAECPSIISYTFIQTAKVQVTNGIVSPQAFKIVPLVSLALSFSKTTPVTIDASVTLKDTKFELYDNNGRRVSSQPVSDHTFTIGRTGIRDGNYFWKVVNNNATIGMGKVVITH